jgi:hypothetical protein
VKLAEEETGAPVVEPPPPGMTAIAAATEDPADRSVSNGEEEAAPVPPAAPAATEEAVALDPTVAPSDGGVETAVVPAPDGCKDAAPSALTLAMEEDGAQTRKEQAEADRLLARLAESRDRRATLIESVESLHEIFRVSLAAQREGEGALPPQVVAALDGRRRGIDICARMLERLRTRLRTEPQLPAPDPVAFAPALVAERPRTGEPDQATGPASPSVQMMLRARRISHNDAIVDLRGRANAAEKSFTGAITAQILPVLDGLEDGLRLSRSLRVDLGAGHPETTTAIESWFSTYDHLIAAARAALADLGVEPIVVMRGQPIDYQCHEPTDVEPDPELADEQVKDVVRSGYHLRLFGESRVLRPAQVVVAKTL